MARSPDPQFEADMMALLESDAMNKLAAYAARGRSHRNLSEQQLTDAWKQAFKNLANDPRVYEARAAENDLTCEFKLRGLDPPYDQVCREVPQAVVSRCTRQTHSITSSASAISLSGIVSPSAFAVFRLITSWYLVGSTTGRSPGFSPLRMRPT